MAHAYNYRYLTGRGRTITICGHPRQKFNPQYYKNKQKKKRVWRNLGSREKIIIKLLKIIQMQVGQGQNKSSSTEDREEGLGPGDESELGLT
jgi:hypothetical protein